MIGRWWIVFFTFWKHGTNFNVPKKSNTNKDEVESCNMTAGALGVSCEPGRFTKEIHTITQSNKWRLLSLEANLSWIPFLKHIQLMVPSGLPWISYGFWNPWNWRNHDIPVTSCDQVAPATWAEKVGFRGGRKVSRGDGKVDPTLSDDYWKPRWWWFQGVQ